MKTHYSRRFVMTAILSAALGAFALGARAQTDTAATAATSGSTTTTVTSSTTSFVSGGTSTTTTTTTTTATTLTTLTSASNGSGSDHTSITINPVATYFYVNGNSAMFQQNMGTFAGLTGGIQNFDISREFGGDMSFDINGHAIFGDNDYLLDLKFQKDNVIKVDAGFKQFYTYYAGGGGYFGAPDGSSFFGGDYSNMNDDLGITRRDLWLDVTTLFPDAPSVHLHVDRATRQGTADDTSWGSLSVAGSGVYAGTPANENRYILPAYEYIDESITNLSLDVSQKFDHVEYGSSIWMQYTTDNDATYSTDTPNTAAGAGTTIGSGQNTTQYAGGGNVFVQGDIGKHVTYGASFLYDQFNQSINSGGEFAYNGTGMIYNPIDRNNAGGATAAAFNLLGGGGDYKEWKGGVNLDWRPSKDWSIVPSVSFTDYTTDFNDSFAGNGTDSDPAPSAAILNATSPNMGIDSDANWFQANEKLEVHYTGIKNMTHTVSAEAGQGQGNTAFSMWGTSGNPMTSTSPFTGWDSQSTRLNTIKLAYTGNWYVLPTMSFSGGYYFEENDNNYGEGRGLYAYPYFMSGQGFRTNDFNIRMTWHPLSWFSNVFRYDFQHSVVSTGFYGSAAEGAYPTQESGRTEAQIISEDIIFTPSERFTVDVNGSLVFDQTSLPGAVYLASNYQTWALAGVPISSMSNLGYQAGNQAVVNADNNYFNFGVDMNWRATDQDGLSIDYMYYRSWNFVNNNYAGLPLGDDETENVLQISWNHHFKKGIDSSLSYIFANYRNPGYGGLLNYTANGVSGNVRFSW